MSTIRPMRSSSGKRCCRSSPRRPLIPTTAISGSGTVGRCQHPLDAGRRSTSPTPGHERPVRSYFLFHGSLAVEIQGTPADAGIWGPEFSNGGTAAFVWPSDHAWCLTADIDPHWAAVGGSIPMIQRLLGDRRLDAVSAAPAAKHPAYG
jgi:hypothetical protein